MSIIWSYFGEQGGYISRFGLAYGRCQKNIVFRELKAPDGVALLLKGLLTVAERRQSQHHLCGDRQDGVVLKRT